MWPKTNGEQFIINPNGHKQRFYALYKYQEHKFQSLVDIIKTPVIAEGVLLLILQTLPSKKKALYKQLRFFQVMQLYMGTLYTLQVMSTMLSREEFKYMTSNKTLGNYCFK